MFLYRSNLATELWLRAAQSVVFRCSERERGRERTALRGRYDTEERRVEPHKTQETPTTRDSPFYCIHHHFIFFYYSPFVLSVHGFFFKSIHCYWGTLHRLHKGKKIKKGRVFFSSRFATLFHQIHSIRPQPNTFTVGSFFKGRLKWQAQRHSLLTLANKSFFLCILIVFKYLSKG